MMIDNAVAGLVILLFVGFAGALLHLDARLKELERRVLIKDNIQDLSKHMESLMAMIEKFERLNKLTVKPKDKPKDG